MSLHELIEKLYRDARVEEVREFGTDVAADEAVLKSTGYGKPLKLRIRQPSGEIRTLVFHTASADVFGHNRRSDRAAEMLLSFDTFGKIPRHTRALDVGAISRDKQRLISLRDAGEFYLLTEFAEGHVYAKELRDAARDPSTAQVQRQRVDVLADYLLALHRDPVDDVVGYERAVRDLVGSGEGIFGIVDGYPDDCPLELRERVQRIERAAYERRHQLKKLHHRTRRIHGDFHPFNIVFGDDRSGDDGAANGGSGTGGSGTGGALALLDTSRGSVGDPADDVTCLAINYVFFALEHEGAWQGCFRSLWQRFWQRYLDGSKDFVLLDVLAPYLAWRGLVLANPVWYEGLGHAARDRLLDLVERSLASDRFDPGWADEVMT